MLVEERGIVHFEVLEDGAEKGLAHPAAAIGDVILGEVAVNELLLLFRKKGDEPLGTGGVLRLKKLCTRLFPGFLFHSLTFIVVGRDSFCRRSKAVMAKVYSWVRGEGLGVRGWVRVWGERLRKLCEVRATI